MNNNNIIMEVNEDVPQQIEATIPKLVSINAKLYIVLLLSILLNIFQGFWINSANERAETNTELLFAKMYPNGSWDIEYRESGNEAEFFPITIDKLIQDYVVSRYGVIPGLMRREYGFVTLFMSPQLKEWFTGAGENQYNAREKAASLNTSNISQEIEVRFVDHFDVANGIYVHGNSDIYRTNVFIKRTKMNNIGQQIGDPILEVVNLHWRIKSIKELGKLSRDDLRANPIGLEIIKDKKVKDLSDKK